MQSTDHIISLYQERSRKAGELLQQTIHQIRRISILRVCLFVAGVAGIIVFRHSPWWVLLCIAAVAFIPFLWLIKYHTRLFHKKSYLEQSQKVNQQELQALEHNYSSFDNGKEFADPAHLYTYDLDIFGEKSLFQYLNRTVTEMGRKRLASWFIHHLREGKEIRQRQAGVREIAPLLDMRQEFRIQGLLHKGTAADEEQLLAWANVPSSFRNRLICRLIPILLPILNILAWGIFLAGWIPIGIPVIVFVVCVLIASFFTKQISVVLQAYDQKLGLLHTYAELLRIIESQTAESDTVKSIRQLTDNGKDLASEAIARLANEMNAMDQRNNMLLLFTFNGLMGWELRHILRIEKWKEEYASRFPAWLEAIGQMDALCSPATLAYNHPDYTWPQIADQPFVIRGKEMGHPLMRRTQCVRNDIGMNKRPAFLIITGANMAGKSTYLRTVGVNYLLACIGAPVCASSFEIYPAQLVTSLRTTDSLTDNESYFFAELKRLKRIIDMLSNGEELFIILDEILKGTNSTDKQKGSFALIQQFMRLRANGIIATHDLLLGKLAEEFPEEIRNHCFEADIRNNELTFSYCMREGVAQNMNACFLMKKMGITVD